MYCMDFALFAGSKAEEQEERCAPAMDDDSGCCSGSVVVDAGDSPPAPESWRGEERLVMEEGLVPGGWEWGLNHFIEWDAMEGSGAYDDEGEGVVVEEMEGVNEELKVKDEVVDDDVVWHWDWDLNPLQQQEQLHEHKQHQQGNSSLNLSLNYQDVLDAWSGRGSPWADCCSDTGIGNHQVHHHDHDLHAMEVPTMVDDMEKEKRRARVMKYREKRHYRLFSKKIRYEVRRLNAEKRPRLKGRFVKTNQEKKPIR